MRSAPARRRDIGADEEQLPSWKVPREHHASDYGTFATLQERLAEEYGLQTIGQDLGSETQLFSAIRRTIDRGMTLNDLSLANDDADLIEEDFWSRRGRQAEEYMKDLVYGGVDGLAYVRSLAEFVGSPTVKVSRRPL